MNWTAFVLSVIVSTIVLSPFAVLCIVYIVYKRSGGEAFVTTVNSQTAKAVVLGGKAYKLLVEIVDDVSGERLYYDEATHELSPGTPPRRWWFERLLNHFGLWYVYWLYPLGRVRKFEIDVTKLRGKPASGTKLQDLLEYDKRTVSELRWFFQRYIYVPDVELSDGTRINVLVKADFKVRNPFIPIFTLNGRFFPPLDAEIGGRVNDFGNGIYYRENPDGKDDKEKSLLVMDLTSKDSLFNEMMLKINDKIVENYGIELIGAMVYGFELSAQDEEVVTALKSELVAKAKAEAAVLTAKGAAKVTLIDARAKATATKLLGEADGDRNRKAVEGFLVSGATPDVAVRYAAAVQGTEQRPLDLQTIVEGGGSKTVIATVPVSK